MSKRKSGYARKERDLYETPAANSELIGKPAGSLMIVCPHCNGESFRLLGPSPRGGKIGDRLPSGKHIITTAECITCGEQCEPFAPYAH